MDSLILERYLELENEIFAANIELFDISNECEAIKYVVNKQTSIINEMEDENQDLARGGATLDTYLAMQDLIQASEINAESNEALNSLDNKSSKNLLQENVEKLEKDLIAQLQAKEVQFNDTDLGKDIKEIQSRVTYLDHIIAQLEERRMDIQANSDQIRAEDENETLRKSNEISELDTAIADQECRQNQLIKEKESMAEQCRQLDKRMQDLFDKFTGHYDSGTLMQSSKMQPVIPLPANPEKLRPVQLDQSLKMIFSGFKMYEYEDNRKTTMNMNTKMPPMKDSQPSKISSRNPSTEGMSEVENSFKKPSGIRLVLPVTDYAMGSSQVEPTETDDLSAIKTSIQPSSSQKSNSSQGSNTSRKSFLESVFDWPRPQEQKLPAGSQEEKQMKKLELTSGSHPVPPVTDYTMGSSQMKPTDTDDLPVLKTSDKSSSSQKSNSSQGSNTSRKSFSENVLDWARSQEQKFPPGSQSQVEKQMKKPKETMMQKPEIKQAVAQSQVDNISTRQKMKLPPPFAEVKRISPPMTSKKAVKEDAQPKPKEIPEGRKITVLSDVTIKAKSTEPQLKSPSDESLQESDMNFDIGDDFGNDNTSDIGEMAESESGFSIGGVEPSAADAFGAFGDHPKSPESGFGW